MLTLDEWGLRADSVTEAKNFLQSQAGRDFRQVLVSLRPRGLYTRGQPMNETQCAIEFGRSEGFNHVIDWIEQLTRYTGAAIPPIEADFSEPAAEQTEEEPA